MAKIIFVTGTDTGVGKTVLTALLLRHLRGQGRDALGMKPFCSGDRNDAVLIGKAQENLLTLDEVNPFFFADPVAPLASSKGPKNVRLDSVLARIQRVADGCEALLVEGIGGLLVPLGKGFTVADLIAGLNRKRGAGGGGLRGSELTVILVSANRLGTINHTLLSLRCLQIVGVKDVKVVLVNGPGRAKKRDISARTNAKMIQKMAPKTKIFNFPEVDFTREKGAITKKSEKKVKKLLRRICEMVI